MCNGPTAAEKKAIKIEQLIEMQSNMDFTAVSAFQTEVEQIASREEVAEQRAHILPPEHFLTYRCGMYR